MSRHSRVIVETTAAIPWPEAIGEREREGERSRVSLHDPVCPAHARGLYFIRVCYQRSLDISSHRHPRLVFRPRDQAFPRISRLSFLFPSLPKDRCGEIGIYMCIYMYKEAGGFERATCPPFYLEPVTVANFVPRPNLNAVPFPRTNRAYDDRDRWAKSFK